MAKEKGVATTLGQILDVLQKRDKLHTALTKAFSNLYDWSCSSEGLRNAVLEQPNLTQGEAKFRLRTQSAFIDHLNHKKSECEASLE